MQSVLWRSYNYENRLYPIILMTALLGILLFVSVSSTSAVSFSVARTIIQSDSPSETEGSIAVSSTDPNLLAAGFTLGTPFRSLNTGATWFNNFTIQNGTGLARGDQWTAIDSKSRVYSVTWYNGDLNISSPTYLSPSYMIVSNDRGASWKPSEPGYTAYGTEYMFLNGTTTTSCKPSSGATFPSDYAKLAIDSNSNSPYKDHIYIVADIPVIRGGAGLTPGCYIQNGFVRSTDLGKTWDKHIVLSPEFDFGFIQKIAIGPKGELYFAQPKLGGIRFYKSLDGGNTFTTGNITTDVQADIVNIAVSPSNTLYMAYLGAKQYPTMGPCVDCAVYLIKSNDGGSSWTSASVVSEPGAVPYYGPAGPNPGYGPFGPERSTLTVSATPTRVLVAWRDWTNSNNATNGDYYAYDSNSGIIRLTTYPGRFCTAPNKGDCTTFAGANDYMDSTASAETIYLVYGVDSNNNEIPDANLASVNLINQPWSFANPTTYWWAVAALIPVAILAIAVYKKRRSDTPKNRIDYTKTLQSSPFGQAPLFRR